MNWIDGALYPDVPVPTKLRTLGERVDFVARLCSAWDFGILPDWETILQIRRDSWRPAVDACRLLTSPSYHLLRHWHHLSPLAFLGVIPAYICEDPFLART
ncbi:MAG: hypothetical protein HY258_09550 [Chloroflexi bacterium]|nr:hypothetical protein [Chloroflexota bacterium]